MPIKKKARSKRLAKNVSRLQPDRIMSMTHLLIAVLAVIVLYLFYSLSKAQSSVKLLNEKVLNETVSGEDVEHKIEEHAKVRSSEVEAIVETCLRTRFRPPPQQPRMFPPPQQQSPQQQTPQQQTPQQQSPQQQTPQQQTPQQQTPQQQIPPQQQTPQQQQLLPQQQQLLPQQQQLLPQQQEHPPQQQQVDLDEEAVFGGGAEITEIESKRQPPRRGGRKKIS